MCLPDCTLDYTLVCAPDFSNAYSSAKKEDNAMKLSGYYPWGLQGPSRMSWMIHWWICDMTFYAVHDM